MANVINISPPLDTDLCYTLRGNVTTYTSGSYVFTADDGVTTQTITTVSASGVFTATFTPTAPHTELEFNQLFGANISALTIQLDDSCTEELCSECFDLKTDQACLDALLSFTASNAESIGDMNFAEFDLEYQVLINGKLKNANYTYEDTDIFKLSTGEKKILYADRRKIQSAHIPDIPDYMHDALSLLLEMDRVVINGKEYIKTDSDYSPDWGSDGAEQSDLAPVIVEIEQKTQTQTNSNCG